MTDVVRMPITVASRKGVSAVAAAAAGGQRVVLTSHGRPVAVVDSGERLDEDLRTLRHAARLVVDAAAEAVLARTPARFDLGEVCAKLGIDPDEVRARAEERRLG